MDLFGYSNENFRKCGEITTALKVGKKVYALNCKFCSKVFIKLHAFTVHVGHNHEQELFGCLEYHSSEELRVDELKDKILTHSDTPEPTVEIKFIEIAKESEEDLNDFQDPLEATSASKVSEKRQNIFYLKEKDETIVHADNEDNCENYNNKKKNQDFKPSSNESEVSCESDNEQHYLHEGDDTKELTLAIIAGFEENHILWDSSKPMAKTRKKLIAAHKLIATSINKQFGMNFEWNAIRDRIRKLRRKFRSELQKQKHAESGGKIYTPIWYYDKLSFLNENLKYQPKTQKEGDLQDEEALVNSKKLTLTIIACLEENRILWDSSEPMKKTLKNRIEAFKIIAMSVNEQMGTNLKWSTIRDLVRKLCSNFRSEVQKQKHVESKGRIYTPIWYYDKLSFLNESEKYRAKIKKRTQVNGKELTRAIIAGFEKHRVLWDENDSISKNRKQLVEAHKNIANSINKQMMTNLKWNHISDRIKKLCHVFRLEMQNQKIAKSQGEDYTPIWYYEQLLFLNTGTEYEQKKGELKLAKGLREYELPLPTLTDSKNLELIDIYKSFPCLWNMEHIEYRVTNRRQEAINKMIQKIRTKFNLNLTPDELQKKINSIRDAYSHESHRKLKCERLNKKFTPFYKFYEQLSFLQNNVSPFKCDSCEETFGGFSRYKSHKSQHDGSMPFTCVLCSHGFADVSNYAVHMRRHASDYPFECEVCKKRFAVNDDVKRHMRFHTAERPYFCEVCGQSFRTNSYLNVHIRRHNKKPSHKCKICSKVFYEKFRLTIHMRTHLNIRDKVCNICDKAFKDRNQLRQHKEIHAEQKQYVCRICEKGFAQRAGLHGHMKSHGTALASL